MSLGGCSRAFYRRQADCEAYTTVECASRDPRWPLENFTIDPDPRSRMFDPFCPDSPPMPPDDPSAHVFMHCVDCKKGWPCWHCQGDTATIENPAWRLSLPTDDQGQLVLDRNGAVETALLQSPVYQQELENVYLSALNVSLQRFQFDTQFFGGHSTSFNTSGRLAGGQSRLNVDQDIQMRKAFATGGDLVVGLANSLVWQFAGPDTYSASSLLDFSLIQPLLRAGGRAVALESLTSSERQLLEDIRSLERFRRSFYVQTVTDYLALLEEQVRIRNQEANVSQLYQSLSRLQALSEGGGILPGDVARTRQSLYSSQSGLLAINASYETRLDTYKMSLGLPPDLDMRIEDPLLARFDLIDPRLTATRGAVDECLADMRATRGQAQFDIEVYREAAIAIAQDSIAQIQIIEEDIQQLDRALPERRANLQQLAHRVEFQRGDLDPSIVDIAALDQRVVDLRQRFATETEQLMVVLQELESFASGTLPDESQQGDAADAAQRQLIGLVDQVSKGLLGLSLIQARARLDAVASIPIELSSEDALAIARENRRDWMNARAQLVDSWRQIELRANDLKSSLDVTLSGSLGTTDNNPLQFRSSNGTLRAGLAFDAPLTRLAERNAYRQSLINYQRARRDYYVFEDRINQSLRSRLRTIRLNQLDFEVQRAAVLIAIDRVNETRLRLDEPPQQQGGQSAPNQSIVERLLSDFSALLAAQNNFLSVWVSQEVQRMNLDLDLGIMQLDARGMWIDPGPIEMGQAVPVDNQGDQLDQQIVPPEPPEAIPIPAGQPVAPEGALPTPP